MAAPVVFYAWQSDLPSNTNRSFIEGALRDALTSDASVEEAPRLDQDRVGVAGSPDLAATIYEKIDAASVVVADVSIVTPDGADRPSPNPNVLVEVGYATRALGANRVILVMNTEFGSAEKLPFDIRGRGVVQYRVAKDVEDKATPRRELARRLAEHVGAAQSSSAAPEQANIDPEDLPLWVMSDCEFSKDEQIVRLKEAGWEFSARSPNSVFSLLSSGWRFVVWRRPNGKLYRVCNHIPVEDGNWYVMQMKQASV